MLVCEPMDCAARAPLALLLAASPSARRVAALMASEAWKACTTPMSREMEVSSTLEAGTPAAAAKEALKGPYTAGVASAAA